MLLHLHTHWSLVCDECGHGRGRVERSVVGVTRIHHHSWYATVLTASIHIPIGVYGSIWLPGAETDKLHEESLSAWW